MEKKESGEKMEKVEVGDGGKKPEEGTKPAAAPVCFKKPEGEDTGILETTKDYLKQLKDTNADTHWDCIKNRVHAARDYISNKTSSVSPPPSPSPRPPVRSCFALFYFHACLPLFLARTCPVPLLARSCVLCW